MSDLPIKATLKAGGGYDAPWLTVDAADDGDLTNALRAIINSEVPALLIEAANVLKAANNAAPILPGNDAPAQQGVTSTAPKSGWGSSPAAAQQGAAPAQGNHPKAILHPEGKTCDICPNVLEQKKTQGGKLKWQCNAWRWNNGSPNNHSMEWAN